MSSTSTAQPDAIQAFLAIATAALPTTTQVWLGKALPKYVAPVTLQVNGTINGRQRPAELGPTYRREEEFDILCKLTTWAGDSDFAQRILDAFASFRLVMVAVANNPTMNDTVRYAAAVELNCTPDADAQGFSLAELDFTVNCQVRINTLS